MQYNPDKKIKIEICQHASPALCYCIWDISKKDKSRSIERDAHETDIKQILTTAQYEQFRAGIYKFTVPANVLCNQFSYLY